MPALAGVAVAQALPGCPAMKSSLDAGARSKEREGDRAWGHFTRRHTIALAFMREYVATVRLLEKGPLACLQAIAVHWQAGRVTAYPGQERLAMLAGYDVRSIRGFTKVLEANGLIELVRERLPDGTARHFYQPGSALLAAVAQFDAKYSDELEVRCEDCLRGRQEHGTASPGPSTAGADTAAPRARVAESAEREGHAGHPRPAEVASGGQAATASGELPDLGELKNRYSFSRVTPEKRRRAEEQQGSMISEGDREIAFEVLATLRERRFGRGAKLFQADVATMVATCVSVVDGDRDAKKRAQLDAIEHAFSVSRGAPTPSYIWGSIDHFLEHEAGGRNARLERERMRARLAHVAGVDRARVGDRSRREREVCGIPSEALRLMEELRRQGKRAQPVPDQTPATEQSSAGDRLTGPGLRLPAGRDAPGAAQRELVRPTALGR